MMMPVKTNDQPGGGTATSERTPIRFDRIGVIRIGRNPDNDVVLPDFWVSRKHAEFRRVGTEYQVVDLGSSNGLYHNGKRVPKAVLSAGDRVTIGRHEFLFDGRDVYTHDDQGPTSVIADDITVEVRRKPLIDDVSFALRRGTLLGVIGPSGCGKSTLLKAMTGIRPADRGQLLYDGKDIHEHYSELRKRIGMVPQDDVLHRQLTVRRALRFAAALRFASDVPRRQRKERVNEVLELLGLTNHARKRIDTLSGGQRKRTSVALELLTEPSLLALDEPTSGLDPALDKEIMRELRGVANRGRTVVVVTHSVLHLDLCDRVLVMCLGGRMGYFGPPDEVLPFFQAEDYADVFDKVTREADLRAQRYRNSEIYRRYVGEEALQLAERNRPNELPFYELPTPRAPEPQEGTPAPASGSPTEGSVAPGSATAEPSTVDPFDSLAARYPGGLDPATPTPVGTHSTTTSAGTYPTGAVLDVPEPATVSMASGTAPVQSTTAFDTPAAMPPAGTAGSTAVSTPAVPAPPAPAVRPTLVARPTTSPFAQVGFLAGWNSSRVRDVSKKAAATLRQFLTLCLRMLAVIFADRGYAIFLLALPVVLGALSHTVPGNKADKDEGLLVDPAAFVHLEAQQILVVLVIGAAFMGIAVSIREIINEASIYRRERAIGLSPSAYLASKVAIFIIIDVIQVTAFVYIAMWGRPTPETGLVLSSFIAEIIVAITLVAVASSILGLLASALVRTTEQTTPILVVSVMTQLVLSGGMFLISGQRTLEIVSWFDPSRWGFAAAATSTNLRAPAFDDALWQHDAANWLKCLFFLLLHSVVLLGLARWALRRFEPGRR